MARTVVVTSGKGGVGKSTLCVALAKSLTKLGKKVLLIELDSGLRCLDLMLEVQDKVVFDLHDAVQEGFEPEKAIVYIDEFQNLSLIAAAYDPDFVISQQNMKKIVDEFYFTYDYIIVDTGAGLGEGLNNILPFAQCALLVVTPDAVCVRDARRTADKLYEAGISKIRLVINKVNIEKQNSIKNFDDIIDETATQLIAVIPKNDELITEHKNSTNNLWNKSINNLAFRLCGGNIELAII